MTKLETNIFSIVNLSELSSQYSLYQIKGLRPEQEEYFRNRQQIINRLSRALRNPVTIIEKNNTPFLVVREGAEAEPPPQLLLTRTIVRFEKCSEHWILNYSERSPINDAICLRFLHFSLQGELYRNPNLWQPKAGSAFYKKQGERRSDVIIYPGFIPRPIITHDGGIGISLDITNKILSSRPLPAKISRNDFHNWKGIHCIYHYGHVWYEITLNALSDFTTGEYPINSNGSTSTLLHFIHQETRKPLPTEVAQLDPETSVALYYTDSGERAAPTSLCYQVYGPHNKVAARHHARTILPPHLRRREIAEYTACYLQAFSMGDEKVRLLTQPIIAPSKMFVVPDLRFGNGKILSVRGTEDAQQTSLNSLGKVRNSLLSDPDAGFFTQDELRRQYLILPQSIHDSYGSRFITDLIEEVNHLFPQQNPYNPIIKTYDDSGARTFIHQGNAIREMLYDARMEPGHAVIMTHHTTDRGTRDEYQLDALVIRELRELDIYAAVIHSAVGHECYKLVTTPDGQIEYQPDQQKKGKLSGYIRNVALNKVLLTNQRWPFVLNSKLHADLTIGIDVKSNFAGLLVVGANGSKIKSFIKESKQKERLLDRQICAYLMEVIRGEAVSQSQLIEKIVIHRDGRIYQSEIRGLHTALDRLKTEGVVSQNASLTILEIPKNSIARVRLFDVEIQTSHKLWVENPDVGNYYIVNDLEGYICTTGQPFLHAGTAQPLYVRKIEGSLSIADCLEDIYALTVLAWTKPDSCLRYPITIKLNDRFLKEDATEYDEDELEYSEEIEEDNYE